MVKKDFGYLYLVNTIILFSTYEVVSKTIVGKVDPFQINFIRFLIGGLILFCFAVIKKDVSVSKKDLALLAAIGMINVAVSMNLLQLSLAYSASKASVVAVIFSSNPIFVFIFSSIIDKERIAFFKIAGFILGLLGITVIFFKSGSDFMINLNIFMLAALSSITYGLYTVLGRRVSSRIGSIKMNAYSFIMGSLILMPVMIALGKPVLVFNHEAMPQMLYLGVFVTGLAYLTYFKGLSIVGASKGSLVFFIKPVLAGVIAIVFLKESPTISLFIGTALIISGIAVILYWEKMILKFSSR